MNGDNRSFREFWQFFQYFDLKTVAGIPMGKADYKFDTYTTYNNITEVCMMVCISRTKQRVACITLMPILCRNQPPLNTPMPDKSTDMHFTARVHWCMHTCSCTALALCHCTSTISSACRHLSGYEGKLELTL